MAITFGYCLTDFTSAQLRGLKFEYFLRTPAVDLQTFSTWDPRPCSSTELTAELNQRPLLANAQLPELFSFTPTNAVGDPAEAVLSVLLIEDTKSIGQYEIKIYETFIEDANHSFEEKVTVEIKDPCTLSKLSATSVTASYDEASATILVGWSEPKIRPTNKYCTIEATQFSVTSSGEEPSYAYDLPKRVATVSVPELTADVTYEFRVTEALYAIDAAT